MFGPRWKIGLYRTFNIILSNSNKSFLFPKNSISSFITPNGSSPRLFLSPSFNICKWFREYLGYETKIIFYHRLPLAASVWETFKFQLAAPRLTFATQINVVSVKRFNPFGKFDFQILMILFLPFAPLNTQFIFSKHVESVILLWKYFVPMPNHFCGIIFYSENARNRLTICLFKKEWDVSCVCKFTLH